jgi:hypothetical protein
MCKELFIRQQIRDRIFGNFTYFSGRTVVDQNKIGQSKFRLCNSIFLRNPSLRKQKCQKKKKNNSDKCHHSTIFQKLTIIQLNILSCQKWITP